MQASVGSGSDAEQQRQRRALSLMGGPLRLAGKKAEAELLQAILEGLEDEPVDRLTHMFHTYPARLPPALPARILERVGRRGDVVLDPFCGGGTTVLEAFVHGRQAVGTDINPIALRIARARTHYWPDVRINAFLHMAEDISEESFQAARKKRAPMLSPAARKQADWYAPHVLLELQGLRYLIDRIDEPELRELGMMVFSSLLVKVSSQRSDSRQVQTSKQVGRGTASRLFGKKAVELCAGLREVGRVVEPGTPLPILIQADARELPGHDCTVDLVITSPPYPGTFDYAAHQNRRYDWLDEDPTFAENLEIGARRLQADPLAAWEAAERGFLKELGRVLRPGARAFVVAGDGVLGSQPYRVDDEIHHSVQGTGLEVQAIASQERPHVNPRLESIFGGQPRYEHLIALKKPAG